MQNTPQYNNVLTFRNHVRLSHFDHWEGRLQTANDLGLESNGTKDTVREHDDDMAEPLDVMA